MPYLVQYFIHAGTTLMILYIFYWVVLRKLTFYGLNRWYLLLYSILAFLFPLINIEPALQKASLSDNELVRWVTLVTPSLGSKSDERISVDYWQIISLIFLAGIVVLVLRLILQLINLRKVLQSGKVVESNGVKLYQVDKKVIPFSFGKAIVLNPVQHSQQELEDIIRHEFIHVKQNHSIDIIFSELLCILNWYNPFAWLIRKAIRQNLEFIADHKVIESGVDKKQYQYLLLKVIGAAEFSVATNFNFTSLKNRIVMMNKVRSAKMHLVKLLFILPIVAASLIAFRNHKKSNVPVQSDKPYFESLVLDTHPSKKVTVYERVQQVPNEKGYIVTVADNHGECVVIVKNKDKKIVKAVELVEWDKDPSFEKQYGKLLPPPPPPMPEELETPFPEVEPLAIPDLPEHVDEVEVINKTITIKLKDGKTETYQLDKVDQKKAFEKKYGKIETKVGHQLMIKDIHAEPLIILDGKELPAGADINVSVHPEIIDNITIIKDKTATDVYGERGKNGVVKIETKGKDVGHGKHGEVTVKLRDQDDFNGLYIIDGKEYNKAGFESLKLVPADIESVEVFKDARAIELYGEKGKKGVIIIKKKKKQGTRQPDAV